MKQKKTRTGGRKNFTLNPSRLHVNQQISRFAFLHGVCSVCHSLCRVYSFCWVYCLLQKWKEVLKNLILFLKNNYMCINSLWDAKDFRVTQADRTFFHILQNSLKKSFWWNLICKISIAKLQIKSYHETGPNKSQSPFSLLGAPLKHVNKLLHAFMYILLTHFTFIATTLSIVLV